MKKHENDYVVADTKKKCNAPSGIALLNYSLRLKVD